MITGITFSKARDTARWLGPVLLALGLGAGLPALSSELPHAPARATSDTLGHAYEGSVEAVQQAELALQVAGHVLELNVRAGDQVQAGQVLLRVDAQAAQQAAAASSAQVAAAQATLDAATSELARKRQLAEKKYISQGALEQAESQYRAARAQVNALSAQAGAARTQAGFHVLSAPFDGVVSSVSVERGDLVTPGRPLLTLYDPGALRVSANVPASRIAAGSGTVRILLAGQPEPLQPTSVQVLPTVDPRSLTQEVRAVLPAGTQAVPGQFARLELAAGDAATTGSQRIYVPASAVVRRGEVSAVYVLDAEGVPQLRQVRLGPVLGDEIELLSGVDAGEPVATDVPAATRAAAERNRTP